MCSPQQATKYFENITIFEKEKIPKPGVHNQKMMKKFFRLVLRFPKRADGKKVRLTFSNRQEKKGFRIVHMCLNFFFLKIVIEKFSENEKKKLVEGDYDVVINSSKKKGKVHYGECFLKGRSNKEGKIEYTQAQESKNGKKSNFCSLCVVGSQTNGS